MPHFSEEVKLTEEQLLIESTTSQKQTTTSAEDTTTAERDFNSDDYTSSRSDATFWIQPGDTSTQPTMIGNEKSHTTSNETTTNAEAKATTATGRDFNSDDYTSSRSDGIPPGPSGDTSTQSTMIGNDQSHTTASEATEMYSQRVIDNVYNFTTDANVTISNNSEIETLTQTAITRNNENATTTENDTKTLVQYQRNETTDIGKSRYNLTF